MVDTAAFSAESEIRPLLPHEQAWAQRYDFLLAHRYRLRPRYNPQLRPTWERSLRRPQECEDYIIAPARPQMLDAIDIDTHEMVYIKRLTDGGNEIDIARKLYPLDSAVPPYNHSVPVLKVIRPFDDGSHAGHAHTTRTARDTASDDLVVSVFPPPGDDERTAYLVMPYLSPLDDPPFETIGDIVDLVNQLLEGLVYMHEQGVAHRDCADRNIMMDARLLYPKGHHPVRTTHLPDASALAPRLPRSSVPVKYYFIDYGISTYFDPKTSQDPKVTGVLGIDQEVPELSDDIPYNPFKVDVFLIGNVLRGQVYSIFKNVEFLRILIQKMTATEPSARPTAIQAYELWQLIRVDIPAAQLELRLKKRDEGVIAGIFADIVATVKFAVRLPWRLSSSNASRKGLSSELSSGPDTTAVLSTPPDKTPPAKVSRKPFIGGSRPRSKNTPRIAGAPPPRKPSSATVQLRK